MKPSFLIVVSLIFGIIILGLATLQNAVLVLAIPLMTYLFTAILQYPDAVQFTVTREITPDSAPQDTPITVKLTLTNNGAAIDEVAIVDILPRGARQIDGKSASVLFLPAQGKVELEYTIQVQRGEYEVYEAHVYARDYAGVFEESRVFRTTPRLVIHPRYPKLDRIKIRPPQTRGFAGPIESRQGGIGIGFWGVREYQAHDPRRQINWQRTARSERELYTNLFEQERVADVGLILDSRERTNLISQGDSLFEHAVRATAALAENFLDDGNRVSLLVYGSAISRVYPGYGRTQQRRILAALAKATPGINYALENLTHLPTRLFPAKSQLVLVSPLIPQDIPVILQMRAYGYAVLIISPDPIAYEAALQRDSSSPAYRIAAAERGFMLRQVRRNGVQIVNWQVTDPLESVIREALARQNYGMWIG